MERRPVAALSGKPTHDGASTAAAVAPLRSPLSGSAGNAAAQKRNLAARRRCARHYRACPSSTATSGASMLQMRPALA